MTPRLEPIAIVGIGCRFPGGADSPEAFWRLVRDGVDAIAEIPEDRPELRDLYDPTPGTPGKIVARQGGYLTGLDQFDPYFFGISPREATFMDPQQRLLLEVTWEAFEDALIPPRSLKGCRAGVFIGMWTSDYEARMYDASSEIDLYVTTGGGRYSASGRLSYMFDLQGPSMTVDTACSSSLVAVHLACQSLRSGESVLALAGGVNLILKPYISIGYSKSGMLSPDGRCKFGDAGANGYVRSEGVGVVLLKTLSRALADGDSIHALVRGSAVNNDGQSSGLMVAPGVATQVAMLREAYRGAGVEPRDVQYLEAHGTGTGVGDPVELKALGTVLGEGRPKDRPCRVGSVKTNIGHTEAASGIAGLIKAALCLEHREIPKSLHFHKPNPRVPWSELLMQVQQELGSWPEGGGPAFAGVNSFGVTGTNAHVILEAAPGSEAAVPDSLRAGASCLLPLSARVESGLPDLARVYALHLDSHGSERLEDVCASAAVGRSHFSGRLAVVASSRDEMRERLTAVAEGGLPPGVQRSKTDVKEPPKLAFLFTGQGSQYVGMGRGLYERQPVFRQALERCQEILRAELPQPLLSVLYPEASSASGPTALDQTQYTQPALFAIEYALAELWRSWGIQPAWVMGHSVGEYVAACVAGVYGLEDGLRLVAARGRLMQEKTLPGAMAAVFGPEEAVAELVGLEPGEVSIAALNGPDHVVISGSPGAVQAVTSRLEAQGVKHRSLTVSHAFHSPLMDPMLDAFEAAARQIAFRVPAIPLVSNLTGALLEGGRVPDAAYWRQHVRQPVRFADAVRTLREQGCVAFLEVGPSPTLLGLGMRCLPDLAAAWVPSLRKGKDDREAILGGLATLYVNGLDPDWTEVSRPFPNPRVRLPSYPFQRERFWIDESAPAHRGRRDEPTVENGDHPLLGRRLRSALKEIQFESRVGVDAPSFLGGHRFDGSAVFPAAGTVEMALAAARVIGGAPWSVGELTIVDALVLPEQGRQTMQVVLAPEGDGSAHFQLFSLPNEGDEAGEAWTLHATGRLSAGGAGPTGSEPRPASAEMRERCQEEASGAEFYRGRLELGAQVDPSFQAIERLWRRDGEALSLLALTDTADGTYQLHPALLDAAIQSLLACLPATEGALYVPIASDRILLYRPGVRRAWCEARLRGEARPHEDVYVGDLALFSETQEIVAEVRGLRLKRVGAEARQRMTQRSRPQDWFYDVAWRSKDLQAEGARLKGHWLVLGDSNGMGASLARLFVERGVRCALVPSGSGREEIDAALKVVDPSSLTGVVHLRSLDVPPPAALTGDSALAVQEATCGSVLDLLKALDGVGAAPRLWLVTRGAQAVGDDAPPIAVAQAPLLGLGRVIRLEHPDMRCATVDLDPTAVDSQAVEDLLAELSAEDGEDQVAYRRGGRQVARLVRRTERVEERSSAGDGPFRLEKPKGGVLEDLRVLPQPRRAPGPGEVEIEVRASGLNFRDVLNALGVYPGEAGPLGLECSGRVAALGESVAGLAVGDEVVALAFGSFSSHVIADARLVVRKPTLLSHEEAATIPVTFLTAALALEGLAHLRRGERLLVHAGAGGVGLAAIQLAQQAGAEVFATAGSPEKQEFLRSLGVAHVMSSRTLAFADEVLAATAGEGVHVVLNSLAGEFIPRSLACLAAEGRFVEIGKRGIWNAAQVSQVRPRASYFVIALDQMMAEEPDRLGRMFRDLMGRFGGPGLRPLPHRAFPIQQVAGAFRYMAQARNVGKIVVTLAGARGGAHFAPDAGYLVTGGLGGLGLRVADWLVEQGARHVTLMGRRAPTETARSVIAGMERRGARVSIVLGDVSREEDVALAVAEASSVAGLRGVVHAAGVLDDGVLRQQTLERFARVMAPKVAGAWNLHRSTEAMPLDFFVLFSSVSALLGSPGQGNYAAANAFMDALAHLRTGQGLPATSVAWGPWSAVGMAAGLGEREQGRWAALGFAPLAPEQGIRALQDVITRRPAYVAVAPVSWAAYARASFGAAAWPFLSEVIAKPAATASPALAPGVTFDHRLRETPAEKQVDLITAHVREQVLRILGLSASRRIDPGQPLKEMGLDSLMAVELRNALCTSLGRNLPGSLAFDYPTVAAITRFLADEVFAVTAPASAPRARADEGETALAAEIGGLSESEAEALLARKLAEMDEGVSS